MAPSYKNTQVSGTKKKKQKTKSSTSLTITSARKYDENGDPIRRTNQHAGTPPDSVVRPVVEYYRTTRMPLTKILAEVETMDFMRGKSFGYKTLLRRCADWGLQTAKGSNWNVSNIGPAVEEIRNLYPGMGGGDMRMMLQHEKDMWVSRDTILQYMKLHHPDEVNGRKRRRLKRRRFWAAGVDDIWAFDQHDKWGRFGLWLHLGLEPVSGKVLWLKVRHTNRNPRRICHYYIQTARIVGGIPLITQSDPGSENYGIANAQTTIRHLLDPSLGDTLQHRWMRDHQNIKPETFWSQFRRRFAPSFEDLFEYGVLTGIYDPSNAQHKLVFRFTAMPWLQRKLDDFIDRYNNTKKRRDRNSILPNGPPKLIFDNPKDYDTEDWKVLVTPEVLDEAAKTYATPDHPVHNLVPPIVYTQLQTCVDTLQLDLTALTEQTLWSGFQRVLGLFIAEYSQNLDVAEVIQNVAAELPVGQDPANELVELVPGTPAAYGNMAAILGSNSGPGRKEYAEDIPVDEDDDTLGYDEEEGDGDFALEVDFSDDE